MEEEPIEMRDFNRVEVDDQRPRVAETNEIEFPEVPRTVEELRDEHKVAEFVDSVRQQLKIMGPIDNKVYRYMTVDKDGYLYYKQKRVSLKRGTQLASVNQLLKNRDAKEFLNMIGYRLKESGLRHGHTEQSYDAHSSRELETVAPEQTESIKSKIRSFKITEEWARKEREKATKELQRATGENEKKKLNELVEYYDQMEVQAKRRYNEVIENQFKRVNEIIRDESRPLAERLKELFRRDGLTIGAVITAIGMTISTIVLAMSQTRLRESVLPSSSPSTPSSPKSQTKLGEFVKRFLTKLANWLLDMAKKALSALPGVVGSLVGFLFKKAGELVLFLSEHLIIFFLALILFVWEIIYRRLKM